MLKSIEEKQPQVNTCEQTCPTCHTQSVFTHLGQQTWPKAVAQSLNIPAIVDLWRCGNCETTITFTDEDTM